MKKLLIISLMLAMVLATVPAFAQQWWSAPFTTMVTVITPTQTSGPTILVKSSEIYTGNIYMETLGSEVQEVTFCGSLGPNKEDVEIDFIDLPQLATDHPKIHLIPEQCVVWGFGDPSSTPPTGFNDHTTGVTGPAFFHSTGILFENSSDTIVKIGLIGEVKGSGGSTCPYSYLLNGAFNSILSPFNGTPTCNGRALP